MIRGEDLIRENIRLVTLSEYNRFLAWELVSRIAVLDTLLFPDSPADVDIQCIPGEPMLASWAPTMQMYQVAPLNIDVICKREILLLKTALAFAAPGVAIPTTLDFLDGIAVHEVRHRLQDEGAIARPWRPDARYVGCAMHLATHLKAYFTIKRPRMNEAAEFDAMMTEYLSVNARLRGWSIARDPAALARLEETEDVL